jgi:glycosyltransferase involved in cell wall biosynthesis
MISKKLKQLVTLLRPIWKPVYNYMRTHRCFRRKIYNGKYTYSVVTACYNVAPYLDDYFRSMTEQLLDFKKHIYLIMVDDGSTDDTAQVIKRWQLKFPQNVIYLYQKNSGQAIARNLGFEHVATPWVGFVDADDFLDVKYFANAERLLDQYNGDSPKTKVKLIIGARILYHEKSDHYAYHPIARYLASLPPLRDAAEPGRLLVASTACVLLDTEELRQSKIRFPETRSAAEDTYVIQKYIQELRQGRIIIASNKMKYYYRQRKVANSTIDYLAKTRTFFVDQLQYVTLPLLQDLKEKCGYVPVHLQYYIVYDAVWRWRGMENAPRPFFLNTAEVEEYIVKMKVIFSYLDDDVIQSFPSSINRLGYAHRLTFRHFLRGIPQEHFVLRIARYDYMTEMLMLIYEYFNEPPREEFYIDGMSVAPETTRTCQVSGFETPVFMRRYIWLRFPVDSSLLTLRINGQPAQIKFTTGMNVEPFNTLHIDDLLKHHPRPIISTQSLKYKGYWVMMDREDEAFDNATVFYEYVARTYPQEKILFAIQRAASEWNLLKEKGFNLLDISSPEFRHAMQGCSVFIASAYNGKFKKLRSFHRYINLQHAVTKDNVSSWMNGQLVDLVTAAAPQEYESFCQDPSPYNLSERQVALTGFPRHDALLADKVVKERVVLIMPTWRYYLINLANNRKPSNDFEQSDYYQSWKSFLNSIWLKQLLDKYSYKALFIPHYCLKNCRELFGMGGNIEIPSLTNGSIYHNLFRQASIFITDYSSAAFELALLDTETLYFQFDRDEYFSSHYQRGFFDYEKDGFGPVCLSEQEICANLERLMARDGVPEDVYLERMRKTMTLRDGKCCERVYEAIKNLEKNVIHREFM